MGTQKKQETTLLIPHIVQGLLLLILYLQSVREGLVELGKLGRDAEVHSAVADLDDKSTNDFGVDLDRTHVSMQDMNTLDDDQTHLGDDLELLALAELGLGDGLFKTGDGLVVELLLSQLVFKSTQFPNTK